LSSLIDFAKLREKEQEKKETEQVLRKEKKIFSKKKDSGKVDAKDIIQSLSLRYVNHKYLINNAYLFDWESDFFSVSESQYLYEYEIKVSKSDFKDDFNKKSKHQLLESETPGSFQKKPNKFFYAVPKGLLMSHMIPSYAGLIEVSDANEPANIIKDAPFLHREKLFPQYMKILLDKFYWRYRDLLNRTTTPDEILDLFDINKEYKSNEIPTDLSD
jgi:hypothetical protein